MQRRLASELRSIEHYKTNYLKIIQREDTVSIWDAHITIHTDSPYDGKTCILEISFPVHYPFHPPKIRVVNDFKHCCIGKNGVLSLTILGDEWTPALTLGSVIMSVASVLRPTGISNRHFLKEIVP